MAWASGMRPSGRPMQLDREATSTATLERARVGVADVLGREDHDAARDEERILARLEHAREPVERGVGVAAAQGLDEGRDDVVVLSRSRS